MVPIEKQKKFAAWVREEKLLQLKEEFSMADDPRA